MIVIKHGNARGTGAMLKVDAIPCCPQIHDGYLSVRIYAQKKQDDSSDSETVFEEEGIAVKLYFDDIINFINVFRGYEESICDGKGIFIRDFTSLVYIRLMHSIEPWCGYDLSIIRKTYSAEEEKTVSIMLTPSEGLGLCLAIENVMGKIAFGM